MSFTLEEQKFNDAEKRNYSYPISGVGPFKTRQEAEEAAKQQQPGHGGEIVIVGEAAGGKAPAPQKTARNSRNLRRDLKR